VIRLPTRGDQIGIPDFHQSPVEVMAKKSEFGNGDRNGGD